MALCAARDWLRCIVLFIRFDCVLSLLDDCFPLVHPFAGGHFAGGHCVLIDPFFVRQRDESIRPIASHRGQCPGCCTVNCVNHR